MLHQVFWQLIALIIRKILVFQEGFALRQYAFAQHFLPLFPSGC